MVRASSITAVTVAAITLASGFRRRLQRGVDRILREAVDRAGSPVLGLFDDGSDRITSAFGFWSGVTLGMIGGLWLGIQISPCLPHLQVISRIIWPNSQKRASQVRRPHVPTRGTGSDVLGPMTSDDIFDCPSPTCAATAGHSSSTGTQPRGGLMPPAIDYVKWRHADSAGVLTSTSAGPTGGGSGLSSVGPGSSWPSSEGGGRSGRSQAPTATAYPGSPPTLPVVWSTGREFSPTQRAANPYLLPPTPGLNVLRHHSVRPEWGAVGRHP